MTSLEKYKSAIEKAKRIKETNVFADLENTSRENFENAYNREIGRAHV